MRLSFVAICLASGTATKLNHSGTNYSKPLNHALMTCPRRSFLKKLVNTSKVTDKRCQYRGSTYAKTPEVEEEVKKAYCIGIIIYAHKIVSGALLIVLMSLCTKELKRMHDNFFFKQ